MKNLAALLAGLLFGAGLVIGGMTDPAKVLAFLTLNAAWDPTLMFVLGGALVTAAMGYRLAGHRTAPLFDAAFHAPRAMQVDRRLLAGAATFGIGWGLTGFCPGPALVGAMTLDPRAGVFLLTFGAGVLLHARLVSDAPALAPETPVDG